MQYRRVRSDYLRNCNHIRRRCVDYRDYNRHRGHVQAPMDRQKRSSAFFRQSFFKSHPTPESAAAIRRRDSGCYHCEASVFLFFFLSSFIYFVRSPRLIVLYHRESVSASRVKNDRAGFMCSFVRRFVPRDLRATSTNDLWVLFDS